MRTLLVLLAFCAIAQGQFPQLPQLPQLPQVPQVPTINFPTIQVPSFPSLPTGVIPGFGKTKTCSKSLSITAYLNCCGPQASCDASKVSVDLKPDKIKGVSCSALKKGITSAAQLTSLLPGLSSKSSPCLSSALGDSFQKLKGPISGWDLSTLNELPSDALATFSLSSLKQLPPSFLKNKNGLKKIGDSLSKMTIDQIHSMLPTLNMALGSFKVWNSTTLKDLLTHAPKYLCGMSSRQSSELNSSSVSDAIGEVSGAIRGCSIVAHAKNLARSVLFSFTKANGDPSQWTGDILNSLQNLKGELTTADIMNLTGDALSDLRTLQKADRWFTPAMKQAIVDSIKAHLAGLDPEYTILDVLRNITTSLTSLADSDLDKLNCSTVGDYFLKSASYKISKQSLQHVVDSMKKCGLGMIESASDATFSGATTVSSFTSDDIEAVAPYLAGFSTDDIDKMDVKSAFKKKSAILNAKLSDALSNLQGRTILKKLSVGSSRLDLDDMPSVGKFLNAQDVADITKPVSFDEIKDATSKGLRVGKDVASQFAKIALESLGTDFSDTDKFPSNTIFNELGENIVQGFTRSNFQDLPLTGLDGFASSASKFDLSAGQLHDMAKRYSGDLVATFNEQTVRGFGPLVAHWNSSVVDSLSASAKAQVARNLGLARRLLGIAGDKTRITDLASKAMTWLNADTGDLDYSKVQALGNLVHFVPASRIETLSADDLESSVSQLTQTPVGEAADDTSMRLAFIAGQVHMKLKDASSSLDPEVVKNMGDAVCYLPDAYFRSLVRKAQLDSVIDSIGDAGCRPISTAPKTLISKAKLLYTFNNKAGNLSLAILRALNRSLPAMSAADIDDLSVETIKDSLETLGRAGFSRDQAKLFAKKLAPGAEVSDSRRRRNILTTLTSAQVKALGSLACGFAASHLTQYMDDTDVICSLSKEDCYSDAQLSVYIAKLKNGGSLSSATADVLSCLGSFAAGLESPDVKSLATASHLFLAAAPALGARAYSDDSVRRALGDGAINAYSQNLATWPAGVIRLLGNITGYIGLDTSTMGCKQAYVQTMTADQIGTIAPSVVPFMQNLKCMNTAQLRSFDGEQARAVTSAQTATLSSSQRSALALEVCQPDCEGSTGSGAAGNAAMAFLIAAAAIFAALAF
ncbi:uncharacterized protein LOC135814818 isoform X2 [Sycon ciliatum]|uniref:uncharacterized protein LOC135814818 isoform X1 n=1 Tax=Sycon ciliatum TaxID=27933 RepID=UPI0031F6924A